VYYIHLYSPQNGREKKKQKTIEQQQQQKGRTLGHIPYQTQKQWEIKLSNESAMITRQ